MPTASDSGRTVGPDSARDVRPPGGSGGSVREVFLVATRLGLTSFGGPIAHLGYFRSEYVTRRGWFDERTYADLVALCQFLPGPASSQLGIAIGTLRAGVAGGIAAWLGFTLPSAIALVAFGLLTVRFDVSGAGWLHGLMLVAASVVALAVIQMARRLTPDGRRIAIAAVAAAISIAFASPFTQVVLIVAGGMVGIPLLRGVLARQAAESTATAAPPTPLPVPIGRRAGVAALTAFVILLLGLPLARELAPSQPLAMADTFYRAGALVFGGGHLILPLLHGPVVGSGWVSESTFLGGYGAAQAVPGPLSTFAAYLGAVMIPAPNGIPGAALALGAIFLPSFLLVFGALPFWHQLRASPRAGAMLAGTNAVVVGILAAALWTPIWTSSVHSVIDLAVVAAAFGLLAGLRLPPWVVVVLGALAGQALQGFGLS